jgi:hypothetical protein
VEHTKTLPPLGKGDHDIVLCDTLITPNRVKKPRRNILLWKIADEDGIKTALIKSQTDIIDFFFLVSLLMLQFIHGCEFLVEVNLVGMYFFIISSIVVLNISHVLLTSLLLDSSGVAPQKDTDGLLYSNTPAKAEILNNQFHSVYTKEDFDNLPSKGPSPHPTMPNLQVVACLSVCSNGRNGPLSGCE